MRTSLRCSSCDTTFDVRSRVTRRLKLRGSDRSVAVSSEIAAGPLGRRTCCCRTPTAQIAAAIATARTTSLMARFDTADVLVIALPVLTSPRRPVFRLRIRFGGLCRSLGGGGQTQRDSSILSARTGPG
jgi:hypothetical protein